MFFGKDKKSSMETEIYEQPHVMDILVHKYKNMEFDLANNIEKVVLVASGSSYHCARFSVDLISEMAGIEVSAIYSSVFNLKKVIPHDKGTMYIFITQSGETTDTLTALKRVNEGFTDNNGEKYYLDTACITNKIDSSIWKLTKYHFDCSAGVENSIAATKSFTAQMLCSLIISLKLSQNKGLNVDKYLNSLDKLPEIAEKSLALRPKIKQLARLFSKQKCLVVTADGIAYSIAKEAALKIKETSYVNVNAVYLGEFLHGHVAVLNNRKSALLYISVNDISNTAVSNFEKIRNDYNPTTFIIGKHNNKITSNFNIAVDCENEVLQMFSNVILIQLLALEHAKKLHRNIDKPKGLKKVVV